jgi:dTDP-4-amino-4,6-dideoxygalactose transaminase
MLLLRTRTAALLESERRRASGEWLTHYLPYGKAVQRIRPSEGAVAGWLRYPMLFREGWKGFEDPRSAARAGLAAGYPCILPELPAVAAQMTAGPQAARWPGAQLLVRGLVTLPTHSLLGIADHRRLVAIVDRYVRREWSVIAS